MDFGYRLPYHPPISTSPYAITHNWHAIASIFLSIARAKINRKKQKVGHISKRFTSFLHFMQNSRIPSISGIGKDELCKGISAHCGV